MKLATSTFIKSIQQTLKRFKNALSLALEAVINGFYRAGISRSIFNVKKLKLGVGVLP